MDSGTIRATIKKQNSSFVIQTPTSVASVKGTDFWLLTDPDKGDQVIGLEGIVSLKNIDTGQDVDVVQGMSGISTPDGDIGVEETEASKSGKCFLTADGKSIPREGQVKLHLSLIHI